MTLFYQTQSWASQPQVNEETIDLWKHVSEKKHWRIVQLPNGFYQTEYLDPKKRRFLDRRNETRNPRRS